MSGGKDRRGFDIGGHRYWYQHPWVASDVIPAGTSATESEAECSIAAGALTCTTEAGGALQSERPNIVIIFADENQSEGANQGLPILIHPEYNTLRIGETEAPFAVTDLAAGEGDPLLAGLQPPPDRLSRDHLVDAEVLADVAEERDEAELRQP